MLERAVSEGLLTRTGDASLYGYRIETGDETITGLVGVCRAADLVPHEGTIASAPDEPAPSIEIRPILALIEDPLPRLEAVGDAVESVEPGGARHSLTAVDRTTPLELVAPVVADGHHRRRAALASRGVDATVLTMVVGDSGSGLEAGTFHRVFPHSGSLPLGASDVFDLEPLPSPEIIPGSLVWLEGRSGRAFALTPTPAALGSIHGPLRESPAAVAQALLYPLLGLLEHEAEHAGSLEEAVAALPAAGGALLLPPVEIRAVMAAARSRTLLPPKASRFRPKPLRGMVLRGVDMKPDA
ncbi:MAG TPA: DUF1015 family protein [Acidimicrobiia bacterium]|nr:DUF1015 family protein [Acidimicrobiia bacterium]